MVARDKPVTSEEFDVFVMRPENADRLFELIGGEVIEVVSNNYSSQIGMFMGAMLTVFVRANRLGRVTGADGGYMVSGERYIPDAAFISKIRQPIPSRDTYNPLAPDLAVEVVSPTDDPAAMRIKVVNYLRAGTMVWVVDPYKQHVEIYAPGQRVQIMGINDILDGGILFPGFRLSVKDIFADL